MHFVYLASLFITGSLFNLEEVQPGWQYSSGNLRNRAYAQIKLKFHSLCRACSTVNNYVLLLTYTYCVYFKIFCKCKTPWGELIKTSISYASINANIRTRTPGIPGSSSSLWTTPVLNSWLFLAS